MLSVPEASERILADIRPLTVERVPLLDSLGRVLAAPIVAPLTIPAWDNSAMDGYAARSDDIARATAESPVTLSVFERGTPIGAAQIGVLASIGAASVDVYRRPRVAFLGSGDEIVDLDRFSEAPDGKKVITSNSYTLHD